MARKRANNEGSIYKRKNGVWRAQVTLNGERLNFSADTQKECRKWLKKTIGQIDNGLTFSGANTKLREFIADWLVSVESALRPNTLYQYKQIVRDHILPALGKLKLKDLRPDHIQKMYDERIKSGFGPRTVRLIHAVLHRALVHAVKLGMIGRNPVDATTPPKYESKEMNIYDENKVSRMLIAAFNKRNEALYHLAITTGMRQAEILGLKWPDLEWSGKTLQVSRQLKVSSDGREYYFAPPKTKAGKRKVVLGGKTIEKLREHRERQQIEREITGDRWQDYDLIFPSKIGTPMDRSNLLKDFKKLIKEAGLPEIRFHDLRHTAASLMLNNRVDVLVASRRLGHSKPSVTLDIYGHLMPGMQHEAADIMDELVTPVEFRISQVRINDESLLHE